MTVSPAVLRMVQALSNAGFTGAALTTMTALGISESGGDPNVINNTPATGDYSVGAFQINYYNGLYASRTAQFGPPDQLVGNLDKQAAAAWTLSGKGQTFNPWKGDFSNGKYAKNLPQAIEAVNAYNGGAVAPGAQGSPGAGASGTVISTSGSSDCIIPSPSISLPSIGPIGGGSIGGGCLLSRTQGKHIYGGLLIAAGTVVAIMGIIMVVRGEIKLPEMGKPLLRKGSLPSSKAKEGTISDKDYDDLEKLAPNSKEQASRKKVYDKRRTYDAKTGKNHLGESPEEVDF